MRRARWAGVVGLIVVVAATARGQAIDGFESDLSGWTFVGGQEFPGARGALVRDPSRAHAGQASARIDADFTGGGLYVGAYRTFPSGTVADVDEFRVWVRARNLGRIGVRLSDVTGQCHQSSVEIPAGAADGWREVVLKVADLTRGEHWGGVNDGAWHGPLAGLGLNLGKDALGTDPSRTASLWIDDLAAVPIRAGRTTLRAARVTPTSTRPGFGTRVEYDWDAEPVGSDCSVFVHVVNGQGQMVFQADHGPPVATGRWSGTVTYGRTVSVPTDAKPGTYDVVVGLWDGKAGVNRPFRVGPGLVALPGNACKVGSLTIAADAPMPKLPRPTLDLTRFRLTFDEGFSKPLDVSAWGPGTRWIAHTPYSGDFGDAGFGDPGADSPFSVKDGILTIEARKVGGKWRSGLLCSVDPKGAGFSQTFGYFEMRAKLPKGLGTWPAFWLMGVPSLVEPKDRKTTPQIEIDVVEQYGVGPNALHTTVHLWGPGSYHWAEGDTSVVAGMTDDFHTYGVLVEDDFITFYFDGSELRKDRTPKEAKVPLYLMVDLALGGGWPIDKTPSPSLMRVDHIRAYVRR